MLRIDFYIFFLYANITFYRFLVLRFDFIVTLRFMLVVSFLDVPVIYIYVFRYVYLPPHPFVQTPHLQSKSARVKNTCTPLISITSLSF